MANSSSSVGKQAGNANRSRGVQPAQRRLARGPVPQANPVHRNITDLQRTAGNQAVIRALATTSPLHEEQADRVAIEALRSARGIEHFFAARFGLGSGDFRIRTGREAAESARSAQAKAVTLGRDIFFAEGRYAPSQPEGRRLLAHELAHVVQQRDLNVAVAQRAPDDVPVGQFGPKYEHKGRTRSKSYEKYMEDIGTNEYQPPIQAASEFKAPSSGKTGTKIPAKISLAKLKAIMNPRGKGYQKEVDEILAKYVDEVNLAFQLGQLDTVESQAVYLAHAAGETGSFSKLTETTIQEKEYKKKGFEGRGPVQVTGEYNYAQTLAYLEKDAELLRKSPRRQDRYLAARAQEAVDAIKKDPKNASNPRYTFLFSAAYMQMVGGVRRSPQLLGKHPTFPGNSAEDSWVSDDDNPAKLKAAQGRLETAKAALKKAQEASPQPDLTPLKATVTKEEKAVQEYTSAGQGRRKVKEDTYARAVEELTKSDPPTPQNP